MNADLVLVAVIAATPPTLAVIIAQYNRGKERRAEKREREEKEVAAAVMADERAEKTAATLEVIRTEVNGNLRQGIVKEISALKQTALVEMNDSMSAKLAEFYIQLSTERAARRREGKVRTPKRKKS